MSQQHASYRALRETGLLFLTGLAVFLWIALATYQISDPSWSQLKEDMLVENAAGFIGAWSADIMLTFWGYVAYVWPLVLLYVFWKLTHPQSEADDATPSAPAWLLMLGGILSLVAMAALAALLNAPSHGLPSGYGGVTGESLAWYLLNLGGPVGAWVLAIVIQCIAMSWLFEVALSELLKQTCRRLCRVIWQPILTGWHRLTQSRPDMPSDAEPVSTSADSQASHAVPAVEAVPPLEKSTTANEKPAGTRRAPAKKRSKAKKGMFPPLSCLDDTQDRKVSYSASTLKSMSDQVEMRLKDFGIDAQVEAVHPGPVVTRFELALAAGTKVSKISTLSKDLARSLSVVSVRVVEVIPGKAVIGLELPNAQRDTVRLHSVIADKAFTQSRSALPLALGKDIAGFPVVVDLSKMPHLLVAGTTGSGKSVGLNAMILSLLYHCSPEDCRMIMIDPKMLELSVYESIPHLLTPVVTDMQDAARALRWCVMEMERRYQLMASLGVRNLAGYNQKVRAARDQGEPLFCQQSGQELEPMPYIVVWADEFADMIMVVGKKVEQLIARLAQKARAAGIHLILATQRPSVDVITGLIKANIPTRIAFQVSSRIDSRTILDQQGAEQLLGQGDMLYLPPGTAVPVRVHGAYVADPEVHAVAAFWRQMQPEGQDDILQNFDDAGVSVPGEAPPTGEGRTDQDDLYDQAVAIVAETRKASISSIQRRLRIGYNRAANLVEAMEAQGVVSPPETNGSRRVLVQPAPKDDA